jgi:hypothetical protein
MGSDPEPEFIFSETRWVHGGGAAPHLATDGLPPTPLPRPRHLCAVRGCDHPQVPGMRGRWRSRTALGRGGARGGVSSHLPRGSVEPRCSIGVMDILSPTLGAGACGRVVLSAPSPRLSCPHRCTSCRGKRWRHACSSSGWAGDVLGVA